MTSTVCFLVVALFAVLTASQNPSIAEPLVFAPSSSWDGDDGRWSSFAFQIGSPPQAVRLLPSTSTSAILAIIPQTCSSTIPGSCDELRGSFFNISASSSWRSLGAFNIANYAGQFIGYGGGATYGFDYVTLGWPGSGGPKLSNQTIGGSGSGNYYTGIFGLSIEPNNFTDLNDPKPSLLSSLKSQKLIPSLSYGYTAGAIYRDRKPLASLTLGGYDSTRFVLNNISLPFSTDVSRRLLVNIQDIRANDNSATPAKLLPEPIFAFIDSTDPYIWLPLDACSRFEDAFNLTWNEPEQMYFFTTSPNTTAERRSMDSDISISFTLADNSTTSSKIDLVVPFSAFKQLASPPITRNGTTQQFFPLKRGANDTQYVLGRTFLQETYLIVDHERSNFSVYQALFPGPGVSSKLVTIPAAGIHQSSTNWNSPASIAGITIAIVGTLVGGIVLVSWLHKREGDREEKKKGKYERAASRSVRFAKSELEATERACPEADGKELSVLSPIEMESPIERVELSVGKERSGFPRIAEISQS